MPVISRCLPEFKAVAQEPSRIFDDAMMHVLTFHLPAMVRLHAWKKLFAIDRDGYSSLTFFDKLEDNEYTIVAIKDTKGYIFGAFCTEQWATSSKFYGDGYSFVFTFRDGDDLEIYPATGEDELYQIADSDGIIIGGTNSSSSSKRAALSIFNHFGEGHSGESVTYNNERLCGPSHLPDTVKTRDSN